MNTFKVGQLVFWHDPLQRAKGRLSQHDILGLGIVMMIHGDQVKVCWSTGSTYQHVNVYLISAESSIHNDEIEDV